MYLTRSCVGASTLQVPPNPMECGAAVGRRRQRSVNPADDIAPHRPYPFNPDTSDRPLNPTWPTPSGVTEAEATQLCKDAIIATPGHDFCHNLFGDEIYRSVPSCVIDIMVSCIYLWKSVTHILVFSATNVKRD